jgi:hypothetical protein
MAPAVAGFGLGRHVKKQQKNLLFLKKKQQKDFYACPVHPEGAS